MAAAFDEAQKASDAAKAAALSALARGGSGALAEYQAAQAQMASQQKDTARAALERAAAINAGGAGQSLVDGGHLAGRPEAVPGMSANAVYDRYAQDSARAGSARQQALADLAGANASYFEQVNAARPAVEAHALAALAARREKEAREDTFSDVLKQLGGVEMARNLAATYPGSVRHDPQTQVMTGDKNFGAVPAKPGTFNFNGTLRPRNPTAEESAEEFAEEVGLPAGYGRALLGDNKAATPKPAQHRVDVTNRVQQHASKPTAKAFNDFISLSKNLPDALATLDATTDKELLEDYGRLDRAALKRWISDYYRYG